MEELRRAEEKASQLIARARAGNNLIYLLLLACIYKAPRRVVYIRLNLTIVRSAITRAEQARDKKL